MVKIFSRFSKSNHSNNQLNGEITAESPNSDAWLALHDETSARHITAMKIDSIELEMSSEFVSLPRPINKGRFNTTATLPAPNADTNHSTGLDNAKISASESVIEQAAVLFSSHQSELAEQLLCDAIQANHPASLAYTIWAMLLDLYQITGKQEKFDHFSLVFARKFETSPPTWGDIRHIDPPASPKSRPVVLFSGKLNAQSGKQLERAQKLGATHGAICLDFTGIRGVDPIGCGLLLRTLQKIQQLQIDLDLINSNILVEHIRKILRVGRRDETAIPWLLLLELLRQLQREHEHEEISIDYSITFEVSPPPFLCSPNKSVAFCATNNLPGFTMPALVTGCIASLLSKIHNHAIEQTTIVDCSRLIRVDFSSAGELLNGLLLLAQTGTTVEFHHVNHLVAALFKVIGIQDISVVIARKH